MKQISNQPISEQKTILKETLEVWQNGYEQTDDITVLGIRLRTSVIPLTSLSKLYRIYGMQNAT